MATPEQELEVNNTESSYIELQHAKDYSNEVKYPIEYLEQTGMYWMLEAKDPIRSERSRAVADKIAMYCAFEIAYRTNRIQELIDFYSV